MRVFDRPMVEWGQERANRGLGKPKVDWGEDGQGAGCLGWGFGRAERVQPSGRVGQREGWAERRMSCAESALGVKRTRYGEFLPGKAVCWKRANDEEDSARERRREREWERVREWASLERWQISVIQSVLWVRNCRREWGSEGKTQREIKVDRGQRESKSRSRAHPWPPRSTALLSKQSPLQGETREQEQISSLPLPSTTHSFLLSEPSPLQEEKREREQVKSAPLTTTIHSFALRAKPTPREEERGRADQELTLELSYSKLCSQTRAYCDATRRRDGEGRRQWG
jgi:hypothetical protein